jgi:hypothetical protein
MRIARCLFALLLVAALAGCQTRPKEEIAPSPSASTSEADKTREMEKKAAELNQRSESIKNMVGSEQEKIDAANKLEKEREELANQAEGTPKN